MRRNPNPAINPQMYRHFAMLTVAITALMAFLANGENHKAAAAAASVGEHRAPPQLQAQPKPRLETEADADPGSWGSDESDGFGQPMIGSSAGVGAWMSNTFGSTRGRRASTGDEGSSPAEDSHDDAAEPAPASEGPSAAQIEAAAAASRLRSGAAGND